jgi:hypothetical protein
MNEAAYLYQDLTSAAAARAAQAAAARVAAADYSPAAATAPDHSLSVSSSENGIHNNRREKSERTRASTSRTSTVRTSTSTSTSSSSSAAQATVNLGVSTLIGINTTCPEYEQLQEHLDTHVLPLLLILLHDQDSSVAASCLRRFFYCHLFSRRLVFFSFKS